MQGVQQVTFEQEWEADMAKGLMCRLGVHRRGPVEIDDQGRKHTCERCHHTKYLPVGPTTGPAQTYGEHGNPPQG
jgi:hypothetical protein